MAAGTVLAAVTTHVALRTDAPAVTPSTEPVTVAQLRNAGMPSNRGYHIARALEGAAAVGIASAPEAENGATTPTAETKGETTDQPRAADPVRGRRALVHSTQEAPKPTGGDSPGSGISSQSPTTSPSTTSAAATAGHCKSPDVEATAQGVSAELSFVGVLLNGQELEGEQFAAKGISDVSIVVQWRNLFSNHRQRVEIVAPDGSAYQTLSRLLTATDSAAPVSTVLPVSGTWITRYGLYGGWCVNVFVDEHDKPVASRRLVIAPS
jgi:hypothetical protein